MPSECLDIIGKVIKVWS